MKSIVHALKSIQRELQNQRDLAYQLGLLSQMIYKYHNAQRREKFYRAMHKLERNMRKFVELKFSTTAKYDCDYIECLDATTLDCTAIASCRQFAQSLRSGYFILQESSKNCMECTGYSLDQLAIHHFISLHTFMIGLCSAIFSSISELTQKFEKWYQIFSSALSSYKVNIPVLPDNIFSGEQKVDNRPDISEKSSSKVLQRLFASGGEDQKFTHTDDSNETKKVQGGIGLSLVSLSDKCKSEKVSNSSIVPDQVQHKSLSINMENSNFLDHFLANSKIRSSSTTYTQPQLDIGVRIEREEMVNCIASKPLLSECENSANLQNLSLLGSNEQHSLMPNATSSADQNVATSVRHHNGTCTSVRNRHKNMVFASQTKSIIKANHLKSKATPLSQFPNESRSTEANTQGQFAIYSKALVEVRSAPYSFLKSNQLRRVHKISGTKRTCSARRKSNRTNLRNMPLKYKSYHIKFFRLACKKQCKINVS